VGLGPGQGEQQRIWAYHDGVDLGRAKELALVEAPGWREWSPRLPGRPIFYSVLSEEYAAKIARDWNVRTPAPGTSLRFQVLWSFLDQYEVHQVGERPSSNTGSPPMISAP
jgi:hypothetical protein